MYIQHFSFIMEVRTSYADKKILKDKAAGCLFGGASEMLSAE